MPHPPTGTVTFLFTDLESSTRLWENYPEAMKRATVRYEAISRRAVETQRGYVVKMMGDGMMATFTSALDAVVAAAIIQRAMRAEDWGEAGALRFRAGIHTGAVEEREGDYYGSAVNRAARLMSAAHGEQVLLSETAYDLVRDSALKEFSYRDLGTHRLRDLARPERVYQLLAPDLPADFPPIKSLDVLPNNLPNLLTTFIGREREMAEINQLLRGARLLTLTGAGGTGKTRLSLEAGADLLDDFPDGVWFVEFAAVTDPTLVPQTIATALSVREEPQRPIMTTLQNYLSAKVTLVILDNCEHLVHAIATVAEALLRSCPRLKVLASSREPLGIAGEKTFRVPSLAVPDQQTLPPPEQLSQFEAVRLFVDRATNLQPSFTLSLQNSASVVQIVRRLDGIPLAIELGAARIKALSVDKIAARLDDQFNLLSMGSRTALPRQQTLNALIEWSFNLLSESERVLFRRLSVLVGGWSLEAAEAICADDKLDVSRVVDLLTQLVEKSLVNAREDSSSEMRYQFLDTIRQYARVKLSEASEENALRLRHADWFLALAEDADRRLHGPDELKLLDTLEMEYGNLSFALDWILQSQDADRGLRLGAALYDFWLIRGYWSEGRERFNRLLALPNVAIPSLARARSLHGAGLLALRQNDYSVAKKYFNDSIELAKALGDQRQIANSLGGLGSTHEAQGEYAPAREHFLQALELYRAIPFAEGKARTLLNLGNLDANHGNYAEAQAYLEDCLPLFRELGDRRAIGIVFGDLGLIAYFRGDYPTARANCEQSLAIRREFKDKSGIAYQLDNLGFIALRQAHYDQAKIYFAESLTLFAQIKSKRMIADVLSGMASVAVAVKNPPQSARLLGAAFGLLEGLAMPFEGENRAEYERNVIATREELGQAAFDLTWAEGKAMTLEQVVAFALGEPRK